MKLLTLVLLLMLGTATFAGVEATDDDAVVMVENCADDLKIDIKKTIKEIFAGNEKYWPRKDRHTFEQWKRDTHWGQLFERYSTGELPRGDTKPSATDDAHAPTGV